MRRVLPAVLVAAALFALYAASAPRTVALEDDAFFILSSHFLGVAHPPGYPLYTALGWLAAQVPVGSVAYRVHLLSALFGAASCAALWLCARRLLESRLAAALAALALGLSPAFWSQAIVAEVYTLNTLFAFALLWLALRGGPLWAMALLFGLSLANHWPLMLLFAPAYAVLLWPRRMEVLVQLPKLTLLAIAGLLPYAWMVWRSWVSLIAFYGPIDYLHELWFIISRQGYAQADVSPSAGWLDRAQYAGFLARELLVQFAVAGTVLAGVGFWAQWRQWGARVGWALTLGFAMPSFVLLLLLGFDYDAFHKHVFHVYPLPAYGVAALWAGLGLQWVAGRWAWSRAARATAAAALLAATAAVGAWGNVLAGYGWVERYGRALLEALPRDAVVLLKGADIGPLAYLHLVEGVRPDVTLYHPQGLVLGNRLFHPIRTDPAAQEAALRAFVAQAAGPVATTAPALAGLAWREHWLFMTLDREAPRPAIAVAVPPDLARFYEEGVRAPRERNPYIAFYQGELRRRYVALAALGGETRGLEAMAQDFYGALGAVEGLLAGGQGYSLRLAARLLDAAAQGMPRDASKQQRARFLELRAYVRLELGDRRGALEDLEWAAAAWPVPANGAAAALKRLRRP